MSARVGGLLLMLACVVAPLAAAQDPAADVTDMQALRDAVRADKRKYVASLMTLTDAEAKRFWPIYDKYQRDIDETNRDSELVPIHRLGIHRDRAFLRQVDLEL